MGAMLWSMCIFSWFQQFKNHTSNKLNEQQQSFNDTTDGTTQWSRVSTDLRDQDGTSGRPQCGWWRWRGRSGQVWSSQSWLHTRNGRQISKSMFGRSHYHLSML